MEHNLYHNIIEVDFDFIHSSKIAPLSSILQTSSSQQDNTENHINYVVCQLYMCCTVFMSACV